MSLRLFTTNLFLIIISELSYLLYPSHVATTKMAAVSGNLKPSLVVTQTLIGHTAIPIYQTKLELVTTKAVTGDGGNSWGGHQTRIVHTQDGVFTAYTVEGRGYLTREWHLAWRQADGTWPIIAKGGSGREPVNLLASPDGTLHVTGWPNRTGTIWSGKPMSNTIQMESAIIPNQVNDYWPYQAAGMDGQGNFCVFSSVGGQKAGGSFNWACYLPLQKQWLTQTSKLDYRFCYSYIFPQPNNQLSIVSTRDVRWEALGYKKPADKEFSYILNAFSYWRTNYQETKPIERLTLQEEVPTTKFPEPWLTAQLDAYIDTKGQMHVLYNKLGATTQGEREYHHKVISSSGKLLYDVQLPTEVGEFSRIFQDKQGRFYLINSAGLLYPAGEDGVHLSQPFKLNLEKYKVKYSGFGLSVPRTGTPLSNVMNVVFPSDDSSKWIYFQLDLSYLTYLPLIKK